MSRAERTCGGTEKRDVAAGRQTPAASTCRPHVVVFEEAQHPQLSEDPLAGDQVLEDVGHLLQSHFASVARIRHGPARNSILDGRGGGGGGGTSRLGAHARTPGINRGTKWLLPDERALLTPLALLSFGPPVR